MSNNNREIFVSWQGDGEAAKWQTDYPVMIHGIIPHSGLGFTEAEARRLVQGLLNVLNDGRISIDEEISKIGVLKAALKNLVEHAKETHPHFESPRGQADIAVALQALEIAGGAK